MPKDVLLRAMAGLSQFQVRVNDHKAKLEQDFTVRFETPESHATRDAEAYGSI